MRILAVRRAISRALAAALACAVLAAMPLAALAEASGNVVRVGWYESPFNLTDEYGRRSGYSYDYQQKIAAYTGWEYEYVEGSWSELMQMLMDGEIDLMGDISYTPERAEKMLFPSMAMGAEEYYIFKAADDERIRQDDPRTLNGMRIGVNAGSIQAGLYRDWAARHGVQAELVELSGSEDEALEIAVGVLDCNNLKAINDRHGHDKGNLYLKTACALICRVFKHSPVFRIGGDEFAVVLMNDDFRNREMLVEQFEEAQANLSTMARDQWESVSVATGVAVYDPRNDRSLEDTFKRADAQMYENKRRHKEGR